MNNRYPRENLMIINIVCSVLITKFRKSKVHAESVKVPRGRREHYINIVVGKQTHRLSRNQNQHLL